MTRQKLTLKLDVPQPPNVPVDDVVERICCNCRFWDDRGTCRRREPKLNTQTGAGFWPTVQPDEWCGEFKRLPIR